MLKHITRIAYKQPPEKGDKGERGARTRQIVWAAGIEFYSGADGEAYADFAYYNGQVYQCTKHHTSSSNETPYDSVENNTGYWRLVPSFCLVQARRVGLWMRVLSSTRPGRYN